MVPLVRSLISIPAGMSNMKFGLFLLFTTIGTLAWNIILVSVGAALGASWESILHFMDVYSLVVYVLLAIIVVGCIIWWIRRNKTRK
jgi:membrane protein DedA with SNARE-associated domain